MATDAKFLSQTLTKSVCMCALNVLYVQDQIVFADTNQTWCPPYRRTLI